MPQTSDNALRAIGLPILTAFLVCAAWQVMTIWTRVPATLLPPPSSIAHDFTFSLAELSRHGLVSGSEALLAFLLAMVAGGGGALLLTYSRLARDTLMPLIVVFQLIPKVALAPLFIVWLGTDTAARVAFAMFLSFFPVLISTMTGLTNADSGAVRLCRSLSASEWQIFRSIRIPSALPYFFSGLKVAVTMAVTGIIVAEFISAQSGLGYLVLNLASRVETSRIFAAILMLCLIGLGLYGLVALAENVARQWYRGR